MRTTSITRAQPYKEVDGVFQYVVEIRCHEITDVAPPNSQWAVGSIAYEILTGKFYGLTTDGWVEQNV